MIPRSLVALPILVLTFTSVARADPLFSPLYSVTDLGTSYTLQKDAGGTVHGVTVADGSVTYAFDKAPVTYINEIRPNGSHQDSYTAYTMVNNGHKIGYNYDDHGSLITGTFAPTFAPILGSWVTHRGDLPVADLNTRGEVVGMGLLDPFERDGHYAAYTNSAETFLNGIGQRVVNNLNNYVQNMPGEYLRTADMIDDNGRILASGTGSWTNVIDDDGHSLSRLVSHKYLLTPLGLGAPATVPEPSTLALLGIAAAGLYLRRRSQGGRCSPGLRISATRE
jgi:hypothetical protein